MRGTIRALMTAALLLVSGATAAQSGIRFILLTVEPITVGLGNDAFGYGLGYDHDLNDRLSWGLSMRLVPSIEAWMLTYRSAYHFVDTGSRSFYLGPTLGVRSLLDKGMQVPMGMRMGVRGSLENLYADFHVGVQYIAGASGRVSPDFRGEVGLRQNSICVGLDIGLGWTKKKATL